jgi:hypothetical protein
VELGGLEKRLSAARLPEEAGPRSCKFSLPVAGLRGGDNPIYARVTQEDGHMAWSSPIYVVAPSGKEAE